jgi:hypothetical protein
MSEDPSGRVVAGIIAAVLVAIGLWLIYVGWQS